MAVAMAGPLPGRCLRNLGGRQHGAVLLQHQSSDPGSPQRVRDVRGHSMALGDRHGLLPRDDEHSGPHRDPGPVVAGLPRRAAATATGDRSDHPRRSAGQDGLRRVHAVAGKAEGISLPARPRPGDRQCGHRRAPGLPGPQVEEERGGHVRCPPGSTLWLRDHRIRSQGANLLVPIGMAASHLPAAATVAVQLVGIVAALAFVFGEILHRDRATRHAMALVTGSVSFYMPPRRCTSSAQRQAPNGG